MHRLLPSLAFLEIDGCPEIESFPEGGLPSKLKGLRIRNCSKLLAQHGHWDFEGLTSLKSLEIGDCDVVLDSFPAGSLPVASLTFLFLFNLPGLQSLNGNAFKNVTCLHRLSLWNCKELQYLPEQVLRPTFLSCLWIEECPILERRYRKKKGEDWDKISHIPRNIIGKTT
ncbi:LRR domain containing protein [Parasponia andersonii]|uniref:LRR domain containing protein n=1 Tax=Parasponia andersonii TaxID=3476 RepID=A0A2P5DM86_PARAD|nr:LRR domain containing protein [Parasponia andersonii]